MTGGSTRTPSAGEGDILEMAKVALGLAALPSGRGPTAGATGSALGGSTTTALDFSALATIASVTPASACAACVCAEADRASGAPQRLLRPVRPAQFDLL